MTLRAPIAELAASRRWVTVITESISTDCTHVVWWKAGSRSAGRSGERHPCDYDAYYFGLSMTGTRVTWNSYECGNACYVYSHSHDVITRRSGGSEGGVEVESRPLRPQPETSRRRGVTARVVSGEIVLTAGDGRRRVIRAPGAAATPTVPRPEIRTPPAPRVVDAELEDPGLFYAYNARGRGHVVFVPFTRLF